METSTSTNLSFFFNLSLLLLSYIPSSKSTEFPICNEQDKAVLLKVRDHLGGPNIGFLDWDNTTNCCSDWNFVGCGTSGRSYGRINAVTFSRSWGLTGTVPSDFGDLPYLNIFSLSDNIGVYGPIPSAFGKLNMLYQFEMNSNSLTGPIPKELLRSKSHNEVDLSNNNLSGPIPDVSSSSNLKLFNVSSNQLCGPIPSGLTKFGKTSFDNNKCLCGAPLAPCKK